MTWTTDIHIGELRPWPESVDVVRGNETRRYVAEDECAKLRELVRGLRWCHDKPWNEGACDQCPISGRAVGRCDRLVRELGIEVDE